MHWSIYALGAAVSAALVSIFAKIGLKGVDSTLATTIRSIVMASFLIAVALSLGKFSGASSLSGKAILFIVLSGIAGAVSWLFGFYALKIGPTAGVSAVDRLSVVFTLVLAALFLGEAITWKTALGGLFVAIGAVLFVL
jgi:transporter family protein